MLVNKENIDVCVTWAVNGHKNKWTYNNWNEAVNRVNCLYQRYSRAVDTRDHVAITIAPSYNPLNLPFPD